jgi:hypothetical protein
MACCGSRSTVRRSRRVQCPAYPVARGGRCGGRGGHLEAYGLTLRPWQLILTGTPLGLYPVRPDDIVRVTAERLGLIAATVGP